MAGGHPRVGSFLPPPYEKEISVNQRFAVIVRFEVTAESAEDAENFVESACERAATLSAEGDLSYEGIEDIEEAEEE